MNENEGEAVIRHDITPADISDGLWRYEVKEGSTRETLPAEARIAVDLGLVRSETCPECYGLGDRGPHRVSFWTDQALHLACKVAWTSILVWGALLFGGGA